ncbi:NAD(P)-dependent oxidoreductase [Carnimonas bestiolae]|uniref:NAD(P)-dependent oxidoreductase n=1 Tax=Carnimonas bestiolae TaxID=3402172 RepID=UPI003EDB7397
MAVAIIGVTGNAGALIAIELVARGYEVTGIARSLPQQQQQGVTYKQGDATDAEILTSLLEGHEAVIHAAKFESSNAHSVIEATKQAQVPRLLVVGGAASLLTPDDKPLIESPEFPDAYKPEASAGIEFLKALEQSSGVEWTFLRPQAEFIQGERTDNFRLGKNHLIVDDSGRSWISYQDYAIALVDEFETQQHANQAFTVGY